MSSRPQAFNTSNVRSCEFGNICCIPCDATILISTLDVFIALGLNVAALNIGDFLLYTHKLNFIFKIFSPSYPSFLRSLSPTLPPLLLIFPFKTEPNSFGIIIANTGKFGSKLAF